MLPRKERLTKTVFNTVLEKGRVIHSPLFLLRILGGQKNTGISAVASKKIAKTAVERNRIRRLIYRGVGPLMSSIISGTHVIVFAKQAMNETKAATITDDLKSVFAKARIMK